MASSITGKEEDMAFFTPLMVLSTRATGKMTEEMGLENYGTHQLKSTMKEISQGIKSQERDDLSKQTLRSLMEPSEMIRRKETRDQK